MYILYRNYEYHHRYSDAADLMIALATDTSTTTTGATPPCTSLTIYKRVEYLNHSVHSGITAMSNPGADQSFISPVLTMDNVQSVHDLLLVASKCTCILYICIVKYIGCM